MSALPSKASFAERLHTTFAMRSEEDRSIDLELVGVRGHGASVTHESFSLMFRAPLDAPARQGSYRLEHASLGAMDVFLVPVKRDDSGLFYEAVFNYLPARA